MGALEDRVAVITGAGRGNGGHNGNLQFIHEFAVKWTGRWTAL